MDHSHLVGKMSLVAREPLTRKKARMSGHDLRCMFSCSGSGAGLGFHGRGEGARWACGPAACGNAQTAFRPLKMGIMKFVPLGGEDLVRMDRKGDKRVLRSQIRAC